MREWWADIRAVAATEFAIVAPFMLTLYVGGVELGNGLAISTKVSETAHTVADLVSRNECVTAASVGTMLGASAATIAPYAAANATVQVAQLKITDTTGTTALDWGKVLTNGVVTDLPANPSPALPLLPQSVKDALIANAQTPPSAANPLYLILGQVQYDYTPNLGFTISGTVHILDHYYLFPRVTRSVHYPC